jgi:ribosomal-protein-alanine N-acetyltransferase
MRANSELRGERIRLRDFRADDLYDVFAYASDPIVTQFAGWRPHRSLHESRLYIQRCTADAWWPITFAIEHLAQQRVIGVVDIRTVSRLWGIGEIGYTLARAYWGQAFNVEAGRLLLAYGFERLGFRRIRAICDVDNRRSYRTMEKLGMSREGVIAGALGRNGRPIDRLVYSLWRKQWEYTQRPPRVTPVLGAAGAIVQAWRSGSRSALGRRGTGDCVAGISSPLSP